MITSKERLRTTLEHKETDRIVSTMEGVETQWNNLKKHFGVETEDEIMDILEIDTSKQFDSSCHLYRCKTDSG